MKVASRAVRIRIEGALTKCGEHLTGFLGECTTGLVASKECTKLWKNTKIQITFAASVRSDPFPFRSVHCVHVATSDG